MYQKWQYWNTASRKWLWILVALGLLASIPVIADRVKTESSSKKVEIVFDYRDLTEAASYQAHPQDYLNEQLDRLKQAGVNSMAMYESTLDDFRKTGRVVTYTTQNVADLEKRLSPANENFTYVVFTDKENAEALKPLIVRTFTSLGINVRPWSYQGQEGLVVETSPEDAYLKPMQPDPIAMKQLRDKGFFIVPRMSDSLPYNQELTEEMLASFQKNGVKRILFEGDSVKGFTDNEKKHSLAAFAKLLNKYDIGLATIENLKKPQAGFNSLAYDIHYNVVRLYSLSDKDSTLDVETLADRFALATKDRNIRMLYLNTSATRSVAEAKVKDSVENLIHTLDEPGNAIQRMEKKGFELGQAEPFHVVDSSIQRYLKMVVVLGALTFISIMVSYFVPALTLLAFALGLVGSAGLYVLNSSLMEQTLALFAAISGPTIAMIIAVRTVRMKREQELSPGKRLAQTLVLYVQTAILSLAAVPFVIALLNSIAYSLVLNQFRGVSLLHIVPIFLAAVYIFFYRGVSIREEVSKLLRTPITVLWIIVLAVIGVAGMYYLSRTGNAGNVSSVELAFRNFLENAFGVRPRNKEFLLAHPLFIAGTFLALKYRNAIYLLIIAAIGQASMVDTFAHIHSPAALSLSRGLLGLGLGLLLGIIAIVVWQVLEGCWKKWSPQLKR
ncbi:DUF5693 family protein [Paenibacillus farraposensis]|uniref:DUF5693 family protein n=1 Tax=Paenibacillus farraposensis TaxID=2807095 RepID=A0ABW4DF25_9BACL|nr:DUF5693 family protein [Paenibacillus farraposensis]MCC3379453.1 hypothetical protein [Paenibacillus farraposensis]